MPRYQIVVSPRAERDIREIYAYTSQSWGAEQAEHYLGFIEAAFHALLDNPKIGRERPEVKAGYRSLSVERHVVFYTIKGADILILGVPHGRMDVAGRF